MHGGPGEPEGVLPGDGIGGACPANTDHSIRGIVVVKVAEIGGMDIERGAASGTEADAGLRYLKHTAGIGFDKNGGSAIIGADDEGCAVGDIHNRWGDDTGACAGSNRKRR